MFKNKIPANINKIVIFDRYGNKVYDAKDFAFETNTDGWDGTFNGKEAETGVYILIIELTDFSGKNQIIKKDLTLVR
ncbi:MAG: gliding motility-associated C-terminal domain-containing protein [Saprospiraceae bacterium]|nr:gliding motility-associated C-terminal domain-containing protein [Saprospiraceae bacterium]